MSNKTLNIYTELDAIYDPRRAILSWLISEGIEDPAARLRYAEEKWEMFFEKNYRNRRLETYSFPNFNIDQEKFRAAYAKRNLSQWAFYRPTNVLPKMLKTVFQVEMLEDTPLGVGGVNVFLNTFPYDLDFALQAELTKQVTASLGNLAVVTTIYQDPKEMDTKYYRQYHYVLKYDILLGENSKKFSMSLIDNPIPEVTFFVPDVLLNEPEGLDKPSADIVFGLSLLSSPAARFMPLSHDFYDYRGK